MVEHFKISFWQIFQRIWTNFDFYDLPHDEEVIEPVIDVGSYDDIVDETENDKEETKLHNTEAKILFFRSWEAMN